MELRKFNQITPTPEMMEMVNSLYMEAATVTPFSIPDQSPAPGEVLSALQAPNSIWRLGFDDERGLIGLVGAERINWIDQSCETFIAVVPSERGKGTALRMAHEFRDMCINEYGLRRFQALILPISQSRPILEKMGFELEGTLRQVRRLNGAFSDALLYGWLAE